MVTRAIKMLERDIPLETQVSPGEGFNIVAANRFPDSAGRFTPVAYAGVVDGYHRIVIRVDRDGEAVPANLVFQQHSIIGNAVHIPKLASGSVPEEGTSSYEVSAGLLKIAGITE